jgi:hypothetical protein
VQTHPLHGAGFVGDCIPRLLQSFLQSANAKHLRRLREPFVKRLHYFMQRDGLVLNMVLRIFLRVIAQSLQAHSPGAASVDKTALHLGAVAFIHRFGSSLNEHVHFGYGITSLSRLCGPWGV